MEKFIYLYSDSSICGLECISEYDIFEKNEKNDNKYITHTILVSKNTMNKEKNGKKYLHIFKRHKRNDYYIWKYFTSYCL